MRKPVYPMVGEGPGFAVCAHVIEGDQPSVYSGATPGEMGLAACEACAVKGCEPGFKLRLWDAYPDKIEGFEIVPASSMGQIGFMERIR